MNTSVSFYNNARLAYRFRDGQANQLTMFGLHGARIETRTGIAALYAQDQWTIHRVTLQAGLRFEHIGTHFPKQQVGPDRFIPVAIVFPAQGSGVNAKDINPRFGFAYDVFGNGKTAVRASLGLIQVPPVAWDSGALHKTRSHVSPVRPIAPGLTVMATSFPTAI
jgi:hypothetical protein